MSYFVYETVTKSEALNGARFMGNGTIESLEAALKQIEHRVLELGGESGTERFREITGPRKEVRLECRDDPPAEGRERNQDCGHEEPCDRLESGG